MCVQRHYTIFGCSAHLSFFQSFPVPLVQLDASTCKVIYYTNYYTIISVCVCVGGEGGDLDGVTQ